MVQGGGFSDYSAYANRLDKRYMFSHVIYNDRKRTTHTKAGLVDMIFCLFYTVTKEGLCLNEWRKKKLFFTEFRTIRVKINWRLVNIDCITLKLIVHIENTGAKGFHKIYCERVLLIGSYII